jgi:hypothetical protein
MKGAIRPLLLVGIGLICVACSGDEQPAQGDNPAASNAQTSDSPEMQQKAAARSSMAKGPGGGRSRER